MSGAPILYVTIPGEPVAAARPRVTKYGTHNPTRYRRWKAAAARRLAAAWGPHYPVSSAVAVSVEVVLPRPKSRPRTGQHALYWHPTEDYPLPIGGKWGDIDNYAKSALDALQAAGIIEDDCAVVELAVTKQAGTDVGLYITLSLVHPEHIEE